MTWLDLELPLDVQRSFCIGEALINFRHFTRFKYTETIPKPRKFGPERLPQDHPLLGNKETILEYTMSLSRQGKRLKGKPLSDHRCRVIMQYIHESIYDDLRMKDDSVPEESDIAYRQEVMTGYENKPILPTSLGVEPLPRRYAQGAEVNGTISIIP